MNPATTRRRSNPDYHPLWYRVLEKQGIATVFALALLWGAWQVTQEHLKFVQQQRDLMALQAKSLEFIAESNQNQEELLRSLTHQIDKGIEGSKESHEMILEKLNGTP